MALSNLDQMLEQIKSTVFNDNLPITIHDVCRKYQLHIDDAKEILNKFITINKGLSVNYYLHWNVKDDITLQRFLIVNGDDDLNFYRNSHENVHHYVYGVSKEKINTDLVFNKNIFDPRHVNFDTIQKTSYIRNDLVKYRPNKRDSLINTSTADKNDQNHQTRSGRISVEIEMNNTESPNKKRQQQDEPITKQESVKKYKRIKIEDDENMMDDCDDKMLDDLIENEIESKKADHCKPPLQQQQQQQHQISQRKNKMFSKLKLKNSQV
ncbi:phosphomannose isomerase and protein kinase domain containing protein [Dermatophagoides farinae]|uniref:Phosphomannose isomerase and protein kinase domain containing protein n=1 Tax=Dermatophagoides farinae TaxID=6954 RepID=A0A9D4P1T1_DERFA|nr:uncharacterized protein LOC124492206 [Dermatophagoides farinae]KAH7641495.1 phosphomannose isomerase and protein kinase domain containing protein [Dermatophagoides farinae]